MIGSDSSVSEVRTTSSDMTDHDELIIPAAFSILVERRLLVGDHQYLVDERVHQGLKEQGVTHIFDCMDLTESKGLSSKPTYRSPWSGWETRSFRTSDDGKPKGAAYWLDIIEEARFILGDPATTIYVHCWAGSNRGPSAAYAIMRGVMGYSARDAAETIRALRPESQLAYTDDVDLALKPGASW